jgi:SAM-dependent methyltransferase
LRWTARAQRADWLFSTLSLTSGSRILDLGCGDGILDLCLGRLGARVTGIDRIGPVLGAARSHVQDEDVVFDVGDLRDVVFSPGSFDLVLMLELAGLMSKDDDARLIGKVNAWLVEGGHLVIDCQVEPSATEGMSRQEMEDGTLEYGWTYDATSRLQHIIPVFHAKSGEVIELYDPYDPSRPDHLGVLRYLYTTAELRAVLQRSRFEVLQTERHWRDDSYLLKCKRKTEGPPASQRTRS